MRLDHAHDHGLVHLAVLEDDQHLAANHRAAQGHGGTRRESIARAAGQRTDHRAIEKVEALQAADGRGPRWQPQRGRDRPLLERIELAILRERRRGERNERVVVELHRAAFS